MESASQSTGLRYWMLRTLDECDNVAADFSADPVHDLRVSLRRCRSMADGMMAMDPDHDWKAMKKAGKQLFQSLGDLRDTQIMMEWIEKLQGKVEYSPSFLSAPAASDSGAPHVENEQVADSPHSHHDPAYTFLQILKARESDQKHHARAALGDFDRKQWRKWSDSLPKRASRIRLGSSVFKHLALERWTSAHELHARALRNRSRVAFHTLRIGIKRFRYIVENFLPEEHKLWSNDLKHMQDLLGEVHDLDVLWATAIECHVFPEDASRKAWHERILAERSSRVDEYRKNTTGHDSLWNIWRAGLPHGKEIRDTGTRRMKLWAKALDPDFAHSERVARLSLQLYDGLLATGVFAKSLAPETSDQAADERDSLYLAALLHDVGRSKEKGKHHKESYSLIEKHGAPLGWKAETMSRAAVVARFHGGALPTRSHKLLRDHLPEAQRKIIRLSAVLRLANALDSEHNGHVRKLRLENVSVPKRTNGFLKKPTTLAKNEALIIGADGYTEGTDTARTVAAERYLLETILRRPIVVRPVQTTHRSVPRRSQA